MSILRLTPIAVLFCLAMLAVPTRAQAQADAAKTYKTNCVMCHADNGSGETTSGKALKAKDLRSEEVQKQSDPELSEIIAKGKGKMPAFGAKIKADEMKELVAYIRDLAKKK
jgi:mono/diheme cytochrome c family protein